jgi:hypothetical protein
MQTRSNIQSSALAQQTMLSLHKLAATIETGFLDPYPMLLVEATANLNRFAANNSYDDSEFIALAESILHDYHTGLDILRNTPQSGSRFCGGGFGLEGFIVGAAISTGLNALLESSDDKKANASIAAASQYWQHAASLLEILEYLMQNGVLPPRHTLQIRRNNRTRNTSNTENILVSNIKQAVESPQKSKWGCIVGLFFFVLLVLAIFFLVLKNSKSSATQSETTPKQDAPTASQQQKISPESQQQAELPTSKQQTQLSDAPPTPNELPSFTPPIEPDWDSRRLSLALEYERKVPKPYLSKEIVVCLKNGSSYEGMVIERQEYSIVLKTANLKMTLEKKMLDDKTQQLLWPSLDKTKYVNERISLEREAYLKMLKQAKNEARDKLKEFYDEKLAQLKNELASCQVDIAGATRIVSGHIIQVVGLLGQDVLFDAKEYTEPIYIEGLGENHADGDRWNGNIYYTGATSYATVLGASKNVRRYSLNPSKELSGLMVKGDILKKTISNIQSQKDVKLSAFGDSN